MHGQSSAHTCQAMVKYDSLGQRQLLCMARALLTHAKVWSDVVKRNGKVWSNVAKNHAMVFSNVAKTHSMVFSNVAKIMLRYGQLCS